MSNKLSDYSTPFITTLPNWQSVSLNGVDAIAFAQAQFANDIHLLTAQHWQWSLWLNPKGRVIAIFALLKLSDDHLIILLPDMPATDFASQLQRYVFRSKVQIKVNTDWLSTGSFSAPQQANQSSIGILTNNIIELDMGNPTQPRKLCLLPAHTPPPPYNAELATHWYIADLHAGLPHLPTTQQEQWTPQQLSLEQLNAFSLKKGCYPGQEIVARTHFLGKSKRKLILLTANADISTGAEITHNQQTIGTVVSTATKNSPQNTTHTTVLGVITDTEQTLPLTIQGNTATQIPFSTTLAR